MNSTLFTKPYPSNPSNLYKSKKEIDFNKEKLDLMAKEISQITLEN